MKKIKYIKPVLIIVCLTLTLESCTKDKEKGDLKKNNVEIFKPAGSDGKDALLWSVDPNTNFGSTQVQSLMSWSWYALGYGEGAQRSLLEFDLSSMPQDALIKSAKLSLYRFTDTGGDGGNNNEHGQENGDNEFFIEMVTTSWKENDVTWNTMPTTDPNNVVRVGSSLSDLQDYKNIDITNLVEHWVKHPEANHGMLLRLVNEKLYKGVILASSDHIDINTHPKLEVTYTK